MINHGDLKCWLLKPEKFLGGGVEMNTRITYLYRDASNWKKYNEVVVSGTFTADQVSEIVGCLNDGEYFIPKQVGFPEIRFEKITEDDHCWFELCENDFEVVEAE